MLVGQSHVSRPILIADELQPFLETIMRDIPVSPQDQQAMDISEFAPFKPRQMVYHQDGGIVIIDWEWSIETFQRTERGLPIIGYYILMDDGFHLHGVVARTTPEHPDHLPRLGDYPTFKSACAAAKRHAGSTSWNYEDKRGY